MEPDFAGFAEAQARLRDRFGQNVVFLIPQPDTWPPGTVLDPETGRPLDPWVQPLASGFASASVKCSVVHQPIRGTESQATEGPIGVKGSTSLALILAPADYPAVKNATRAKVLDVSYKVEQFVEDATGSTRRWICFVEER